MEQNEFGKLVRAYRGQRGLTQAELADLWGYSRSYITQIENGRRRLDRPSQINRLAELLNIPKERLYAIGREIPDQEQFSGTSIDRSVLEMLLAPGKDMVRLSWMVWLADQHPAIEDNLRRLVINLESTLTSYRGEFVVPAQTLLACAHHMMGKIAFDRLDYAAASGHFTEMQELGKILNDVDIQALALIHQGDLLRKRRRYELAFRRLEMAQPYADAAAPGIRGLRYIILARGFYCFGDEPKFLKTIDTALDIARQTTTTIDNLANQFTLDDVLQEQAAGFTTLWHPGKALEIYQEMDRLHPSRPLREQGSYIIDKAQAFFHLGDLDRGLKLALQGIKLAQEYRSPRHIMRLDTTYDRLLSSPLGKETQMKDFQEVLINAHRAEKLW